MTITGDLQRELVNYIVEHSGHDIHRDYIGLSGIGDCPALIYDRYMQGTPASVSERMKTAISYDLERILIEKLDALHLYNKGYEINLYNGLVQGHTDGWIRNDLLEIKTIEKEEWFPANLVPFKVYMQVQAYMWYLKTRWTQVIYLARDNGVIRMYGVRHDERKGIEIEAKLDYLVTMVTKRIRPECTCGKCE